MKTQYYQNTRRAWLVIALSACLWLSLGVGAQDAPALTLAAPFSSDMVLQRDMAVPVWGWAAPGDRVTVAFAGQSKSATADAAGKWSLALEPLAGTYESRELTVSTEQGAAAVTLTNVVVGDVWICAGQSNMEKGLNLLNGDNPRVAPVWNSPEKLARASNPRIRLYCAPKQVLATPADRYLYNHAPEHLGLWKTSTIENATHTGIWYGFSAVGFFFGEQIQAHAGVPIGLVQVAHGGTAAEAWMSPEAVKSLTHTPFVPALESAPGPGEAPKSADFNRRSACYNGILSPLLPMAVRGVIWYQGESNAGDWHYAEDLETLIADWRAGFGQPQLPFYIVQISSLQGYFYNHTAWAAIREAQMQVAIRTPHSGLVVTTDLYNRWDPKNIHPDNKEDVARRLSRWALRDVYGQTDIQPSGPIYREMTIEGDSIRLHFDHAEGGLLAPGAQDSHRLPGFIIASEDRIFHPAMATADGETVVVRRNGMANPRYVRYGWDIFVPRAFYNQAGLPASPFRTDDWKPGVTFDD